MANLKNLITRNEQVAREMEEQEQVLQTAPEGDLVARRLPSGKYSYTKKIHLPEGKTKEIYLGIEPTPEACALAKKRYAQKMLPSLKQEKTLLDKWIAFLAKGPAHDHFLQNYPGLQPLLQRYTEEEAFAAWKNAAYDRYMNYPDQLKFTTVVPGLLVRSKSEADILSRLEFYKVPYHYDEIAMLNGAPVAIDFTCLNLTTKQTLYWDHRGMLDNPAYIQKTLYCEEVFLKAGLIPWKNLIITTETKDSPLDIQWVDTIIQHYLL